MFFQKLKQLTYNITHPYETIVKYLLKNNEEKKQKFLAHADFIDFIIQAVFIVFVIIRPFIVTPYFVIGKSMYPTYNDWDYLLIDKFTYQFIREPKRGEVIVLHPPMNESQTFLKRIIALPNEKILITSTSTTIFNKENPNGFVLQEYYINGESTTPYTKIEKTLKSNEYYVMGDNRPHSSDSRYFGPVTREEIIGRVFIRMFPFTKIQFFPGYINFNEINHGK